MITVSELDRLAGYFSVIHHTPGRLRVRVNPSIRKESEGTSLNDVNALVERIPGIKSFKINKIVASITLEYDKELFPPALWEDWLNRRNLEEVAERIESLAKEIHAGE